MPLKNRNTENSVITGSTLKRYKPLFWISVNLCPTNYVIVLIFAKFKCKILLQGFFDATNTGIYHTLNIEKSERKEVP